MPAREPWLLLLACGSLAGWTWLAVGRGRFWRGEVDAHRNGAPRVEPSARVEVIVPARNEARTVGSAVASLVRQRYAGPLSVTLVDDDSSDETVRVADAAIAALPQRGRFAAIPGRSVESPWTGKLNALDTGVAFARAQRGAPDFWLFTDADIEHDASNVADLVEKAERDDLDLVSLMVRLRCESAWEKLLVPAFVFFFRKLYPFDWSNDPARSTAAAAGGCILVRAGALERSGGLQAIASRLIDDCALAAAIKGAGGSTWLGLSSQTISVREYEGLGPFWTMVKRTAFTQLRRSYALTGISTVAMVVLYAVPPALLVTASVRRDVRLACVAGAAWLLMAWLYAPTLRVYKRPLYESFALPLAAALYMAMTLDSALAHARGRGGAWKGRIVDDGRAISW
jgi:hopene-associated glycosyltransferase HpnB